MPSSALGQQFEGAVNGGVADARVFLLHQAVEFVGGKMIAGFQEGVQDDVALSGLLQANALEVAMQDLLGLADHLAGDRGLIIDALVEHGGGQRVRISPGHIENEIHFQQRSADWTWATIKGSS
jgi:hypothetical protein